MILWFGIGEEPRLILVASGARRGPHPLAGLYDEHRGRLNGAGEPILA